MKRGFALIFRPLSGRNRTVRIWLEKGESRCSCLHMRTGDRGRPLEAWRTWVEYAATASNCQVAFRHQREKIPVQVINLRFNLGQFLSTRYTKVAACSSFVSQAPRLVWRPHKPFDFAPNQSEQLTRDQSRRGA